MKIGWTPRSVRSFKRLVRKNPQLRPLVEATLELLSEEAILLLYLGHHDEV